MSQKLVQKAIVLAGTIAQDITFTSKGVATLNPATDIATSLDVDYSLKAIFASYNSERVANAAIEETDMKVIIAYLDLGATPKKDDIVTDENSIEWIVVNRRKDPTNAVWVLQVRLIG